MTNGDSANQAACLYWTHLAVIRSGFQPPVIRVQVKWNNRASVIFLTDLHGLKAGFRQATLRGSHGVSQFRVPG